MAEMKRKCQLLDSNGKRCGCTAVGSVYYHGDQEIYGFTSVTWVVVYLCRKHLDVVPKGAFRG